MASKREIQAGGAVVSLRLDRSPLEKGLQATQQLLQGWGKGIAAWGASLTGAGALVTAPFAAGMKIFSEWGGQVAAVSRKTGVEFERLQLLAAGLGVGVEDLQTPIRKMSTVIEAASRGGAEAQRTLGELGLTVEDLSKSTQDERMLKLAQALGKVRDDATRSALAVQIFGKSAQELNLAGGIEGIRQRQRRVQMLGGIMSAPDVASARDYNRAVSEMGIATKGIWASIGAAAAPILTDLARWATIALVAVRNWVDQNRPLLQQIFAIGLVLTGTGGTLVWLGAMVWGLGYAVSFAAKAAQLFTWAWWAVTLPLRAMWALTNLVTVAIAGQRVAALASAAATWLWGAAGMAWSGLWATAMGLATLATLAFNAVVTGSITLVGLLTGATWALIGGLAALALAVVAAYAFWPDELPAPKVDQPDTDFAVDVEQPEPVEMSILPPDVPSIIPAQPEPVFLTVAPPRDVPPIVPRAPEPVRLTVAPPEEMPRITPRLPDPIEIPIAPPVLPPIVPPRQFVFHAPPVAPVTIPFDAAQAEQDLGQFGASAAHVVAEPFNKLFAMQDRVRGVWNVMTGSAGAAARDIGAAFSTHMGGIVSAAQTTWGGVMAAFQAGDMDSVWEILEIGGKLAWEHLKEFAEIAWMDVGFAAEDTFNAWVDAAGDAGVNIWTELRVAAESTWSLLKFGWYKLVGVMVSAFGAVYQALFKVADLAADVIETFNGDWAATLRGGIAIAREAQRLAPGVAERLAGEALNEGKQAENKIREDAAVQARQDEVFRIGRARELEEARAKQRAGAGNQDEINRLQMDLDIAKAQADLNAAVAFRYGGQTPQAPGDDVRSQKDFVMGAASGWAVMANAILGTHATKETDAERANRLLTDQLRKQDEMVQWLQRIAALRLGLNMQ